MALDSEIHTHILNVPNGEQIALWSVVPPLTEFVLALLKRLPALPF